MTDEEVERRYHELQLAKLNKLVTKLPDIKRTDRQYCTKQCEHCKGTGREPQSLDGWYIDYHYQDGHDMCGPYDRDEAIRLYTMPEKQCANLTLIGPDGMVYTI